MGFGLWGLGFRIAAHRKDLPGCRAQSFEFEGGRVAQLIFFQTVEGFRRVWGPAGLGGSFGAWGFGLRA